MSFKNQNNTALRGRKVVQENNKVLELTTEYPCFFPIHSDEEGKMLCSILNRTFHLTRFFANDVLIDIGLDEDIVILCDQLGLSKFINLEYDTFYEITI